MPEERKGLDLLQQHLDANDLPDDWPQDVCRDAWCGFWERNNGYVWHRLEDHRGLPVGEGPPIGTRPEFSRRFVVGYTIAVVLIGGVGFIALTCAMWWS